MCGRFSLTQRLDVLERIFKAKARAQGEQKARYNIAPTQPVLAICQDDPDSIVELDWGITIFPNDEPPRTLVNAKAETLQQRPAYSQAFEKRRCLVLADGFFEWESRAGRRYPHYYRLRNNEPFAFAGVYDQEGDDRHCVIITTDSNGLVAPVHDRMPVILEDARKWLTEENPDELQAMLRPVASSEMESYTVNPIVNTTDVDSPECIEPYEPKELKLF
ncbi:MAG: SOS response-associated peptidase [Candidatus Eremiobacteraeota bacterium]|nr:SOS response-associated peptidase [Candidatus Eremiobacteraeota bacterium]